MKNEKLTDHTKEAEVLTGEVLYLCRSLAYPAPTVKRVIAEALRRAEASGMRKAAK